MKQLENKRTIITGGLRGIGKAIVKRFLEEGAIVCTTYAGSKELVEEVKAEFHEFKNRLFICHMDVTDPEGVETGIQRMLEHMGGVDVLVNNAGVTSDKLFFMMTNEEWDKVIKTNLYGPFYTTKQVIVPMAGQKSGCVINVASISGIIGVAGQSNYCASKFGLIGMTKSLAKEYANKNIRFNAIAPGYIETDMVKNMGEKAKTVLPKKGVMQRFGKTCEVADSAVFLASDQAAYVTGQVLVIDGGFV